MDHHEAASFRVGHRKVPPSRSLRSQHWHALSVITPQRPRNPDSDSEQVHSILAATCTWDSAAQHQLLAEAVHPAPAKLLIPSAQTAGCPIEKPGRPNRVLAHGMSEPTGCSCPDRPAASMAHARHSCSRPRRQKTAPTSLGFADVHVWDLPTGAVTAAHLRRDSISGCRVVTSFRSPR
jgi:hypothetical protein